MLVEELVNLTPSAIMEFFELDVRHLPNSGPLDFEDPNDWGIYRFYAWGMNELNTHVEWQGKQYAPYPMEVRGFNLSGDKQVPRPVMTISNLATIVQELVYKYEDIVGGKVTRKRTFAKFLDASNFIAGNATEDQTQEFPDTVYYIRKKTAENMETIVFELSSPWDMEGIKLPRRVMNTNVCYWKYRSTECGYIGDKYFDIKDNPCSASDDACGKRLSSCLLRFPNGQEVRFGGFPALGAN